MEHLFLGKVHEMMKRIVFGPWGAGLLAVFIFCGIGKVSSAQTLSCEQPGSTERKLTFINQCGQDIWVGVDGNDGQKCMNNQDCPDQDTYCSPVTSTDGDSSCSTNAQCNPGDFCSEGKCKFRQCTFVPLTPGSIVVGSVACDNNSQCADSEYCHAPTKTCATIRTDGNGWKMQTKGSPMTVCAPNPWAGRFWARTGCGTCTGGECLCDTGQCLGTDGKTFSLNCAVSGQPPVSLVEPNMLTVKEDTYDVSMVDGANIPVQIVPDPSTFDISKGIRTPEVTCSTVNDPVCTQLGFDFSCDVNLKKCVNKFFCGSPGCTDGKGCQAKGFADNILDACSWNGDLAIEKNSCTPAALQKKGKDGSTYVACDTPDSVCPNDPMNQLECTAVSKLFCQEDQDCGENKKCDTAQGVCQTTTTTNQNLYECSGPNVGSCYSFRTCSKPKDPQCEPPNLPDGFRCDVAKGMCVDPNCCGCASWAPKGPGVNGTQCVAGSNPKWKMVVEPLLNVFHSACPLAYTFPYDDIGRTFTCQSQNLPNLVDYTITFCPNP